MELHIKINIFRKILLEKKQNKQKKKHYQLD